MQSGWQPANQAESDMAEALADGDARRFGTLVLSSRLYLPKLPARNTERWWELAQRLPLDSEHVLAFTSAEAVSAVLGPYARGYTETDLAAVVGHWPDTNWLLALNPGLPIGIVLPPGAVPALARGEETLTPVAEVQEQIADKASARISQICLTGLGAADRPPYRPAQPNGLETALTEAAAAGNGDAFLDALIGAEVFVPAHSVPALDELEAGERPWLVIGDELPIVPVFSSAAALEHCTSAGQARVAVSFLSIVAEWPGETHALCFNPGTDTELILLGDTMMELLAEIAESVSDGTTQSG